MPESLRRLAQVLLASMLVAPSFAAQPAVVQYVISLRGAPTHYVDVAMGFHAGENAKVQLPVWNATYVVRDFAENLSAMRLHRPDGTEQLLRKLDKTSWQVPATGPVELRYRIYLDDPGPFGAEVSEHHAFFNLAELLPFVSGEEHRQQLTSVDLVDVPATWKMAVALPHLGGVARDGKSASFTLHAASYDLLVDSPVELSQFEESDFTEAGKQYRVVVHGAKGDYDLARMTADIHKIVAAETAFMHEAPFAEYTFLYHVGAVGGGGMEHAYSTAIGLRPLADEAAWRSFDSVTAHEFFHLWNVKRIRPRDLEPVDYTEEMYTRQLWFSEGVTSTVAEYMLLRAGLSDQQRFEQTLGREIGQFRSRPAHAWQSPEESSLDTWFTKYPDYNLPDRSVSYYLSGELIGYLLDLDLRARTGGSKSLQDLLLWMNAQYAHTGSFFPDGGVELAADAVSGADYHQFFAANIASAADLPFETELASAGYALQAKPERVADPGFDLARSFSAPPTVLQVRDTAVRQAGLRENDRITTIAGADASSLREALSQLAALTPGSTLKLTVERAGKSIDLMLPVGSREETRYELVPLANPSPQQLARRRAWLNSEDQP